MNLCVGVTREGRRRKTFELEQTSTDVTYRVLALRTTKEQYEAYCVWLREEHWAVPPDWVEDHLRDLKDFLEENHGARFYDS